MHTIYPESFVERGSCQIEVEASVRNMDQIYTDEFLKSTCTKKKKKEKKEEIQNSTKFISQTAFL